jgi:hypothetical protein
LREEEQEHEDGMGRRRGVLDEARGDEDACRAKAPRLRSLIRSCGSTDGTTAVGTTFSPPLFGIPRGASIACKSNPPFAGVV